MKSVRILTLNCWSEGLDQEKRWPLIAEELACLNPDIACFQEVFRQIKMFELREALGANLCLGGMRRHGGLVLLSSRRRLADGFLRYKTKSPTEDYYRYALWARLELGEEPWDFFVTHLSWKLPESPTRQQQMTELWNWIDEKNGGLRPCVIAGDMNATPDSDEIEFLAGRKWLYLSRGGLAQTVKAHHPFLDTCRDKPKTFFTWSSKNRYTARADLPERRIDYVWFRPPVENSKFRYKIISSDLCFHQPKGKNLFPSDHFGVITEIAYS